MAMGYLAYMEQKVHRYRNAPRGPLGIERKPMSAQHVQNIVQELSSNPDLRDKVIAAGSQDERKALMEDAGLTVPSVDAVKGADLSDVSGAGSTNTVIAVISAFG
jgi:hypothetical protein